MIRKNKVFKYSKDRMYIHQRCCREEANSQWFLNSKSSHLSESQREPLFSIGYQIFCAQNRLSLSPCSRRNMKGFLHEQCSNSVPEITQKDKAAFFYSAKWSYRKSAASCILWDQSSLEKSSEAGHSSKQAVFSLPGFWDESSFSQARVITRASSLRPLLFLVLWLY